MMRNILTATALAGALFTAVPAIAEGHGDMAADTVVATVNGVEITLGQMIVARAQLPDQYQQLPAEVLFDGILDQLVQQELLAATLEEAPARVAIALQNQERSLKAGEVVNDLYEGAVSEEAVQAAYDARIAEMGESFEYNASHILVETEEEAQALVTELEGGADFATLAREKSTGPSGPNGGELGWFGRGMMVAPFEAAVVDLEVGAVSAPVQTQFGWHVIILNDRRAQEPPAIEMLRPELEGLIQETALNERLAELEAAGEVTRPEEGAFDPALINDMTLLEN